MEEFNLLRAKMREHVAQMVVAIGQPDEIVPAESIQVLVSLPEKERQVRDQDDQGQRGKVRNVGGF